jgi:hypothetical protein
MWKQQMLGDSKTLSAMMRGYFTKLTYRCRIPYQIRILPGYFRIRIGDVSDIFVDLNK